jgi:hypothetical protein
MKLGNKHSFLTQTLFILAILIFAITSLTHVAVFWGVANSFYISAIIAIATGVSIIASLLSTKYTKLTYLSFLIVVIIELVGNIYACFVEIDVNSEGFKAWKELTAPIFEAIFSKDENGVIPDVTFKRSIAILQGSLIPILLSILFHMYMVVRERVATSIKREKSEQDDPPKEDTNIVVQEDELVKEVVVEEPSEELVEQNEVITEQNNEVPEEIITPDNYLEVSTEDETSLEVEKLAEPEAAVTKPEEIVQIVEEPKKDSEVVIENKLAGNQKVNVLRNDEMGTIILKPDKK